MADQVQTVVSRDAPFLEAAREQNILDAIAAVQSRGAHDLPAVPTAGESASTKAGRQLAQSGVGSYAPYIQGAATTLGTAGGVLGQGAGITQLGMNAADYFPYGHTALSTVPSAVGLAGQQAQGAMGAGSSWFQGAGDMYDPRMAEPFYDPYQQQVIDTQHAEIDRLGDMQRMQARGQAVQAGAFGGTRGAIQETEIGRNTLDQQARTGAQIRSSGYQWAQTQAQQAFEDAMRRRQQAGSVLGDLGMRASQQTLAGGDMMRQMGLSVGALAGQESDIYRGIGSTIGQIGGELGNIGTREGQLGELQSSLLGTDVQRLTAVGEVDRAQRQKTLDAQHQTALQNFYRPYQDVGFVSDIIGKVPSSQMTTTATTSAQPSLANQVAGAGLGIAGLFG